MKFNERCSQCGFLSAAPGRHKCDGCGGLVKALYTCGAETYDCAREKRYCIVCVEEHTGGDSAHPQPYSICTRDHLPEKEEPQR